jgi:hypothetical protein
MEIVMSYTTLYHNKKFVARRGLEGPFTYLNGRVLYYDPKEGQYYDPLTDFYVDNDEVGELHGLLMDRMRKLS